MHVKLKLSGATAHEDQGLLCPSQCTRPLGIEVHEQMSRSGGQSEARPPPQCLSPQASLVLIYQTTAYILRNPIFFKRLYNSHYLEVAFTLIRMPYVDDRMLHLMFLIPKMLQMQKVSTPSTALRYNYQCLKYKHGKDSSQALARPFQQAKY
ncbi:UNVERIFIED_CONTAM: hypothetical protein NCL1_26062 [Trichonephila clavipes]